MKLVLRSLFVVLFFCGCTSSSNGADGELKSSGSRVGYDISGKKKSCKPLAPNTICTMSYTEGDQYGADCQKAGHKATKCGCHDYICSKKLAKEETGYDLHGEKRSCIPVFKKRCTRSLTPSDRFRSECIKKGLQSNHL